MLLLLFFSRSIVYSQGGCNTPLAFTLVSSDISEANFITAISALNIPNSIVHTTDCNGRTLNRVQGVGTGTGTYTYYINGIIQIKNSFTFSNCNFVFGPNGGIKMSNAILTNNKVTLTINNCSFTGCNYPFSGSAAKWLGIEVDDNNSRSLYITGSTISGATTAVSLLQNGGTNCASYFIQSSHFNENWIGIHIDGIPSTTGVCLPNLNRIVSSTFDGGGGAYQLPSTIQSYGNTNTNGDRAIWVSNNTGTAIVIGDYRASSSALYSNTISNYSCGIYSELGSNLTVRGCEISNCSTGTSSPPVYYGSMIYASGGITTGPTLTIGDATNSLAGNYLNTSVGHGISTKGTLTNVIGYNSFMDITNTNININATYGSNLITQNTISNSCATATSGCNTGSYRGIVVNALQKATVDINNNNIRTIGVGKDYNGNSSAVCGVAIFLNGLNTPTSYVSANTISNTPFGIYVHNCSNVQVLQNSTININTNPWQGADPNGNILNNPYWAGMYDVYDQGSNIFSQNNVTVTNPAGHVYSGSNLVQGRTYGMLDVSRAKPSYVSCNSFTSTDWGIASTASGTNVMTLKNNTMTSNQAGITIFQNGIIGQQGAANMVNDNQWVSCGHTLGVYSAVGTGQTFYVRPGAASACPPTSQIVSGLGSSFFPTTTVPVSQIAVSTSPTCISRAGGSAAGARLMSGYDAGQLLAIAQGDYSSIADYNPDYGAYLSDLLMQAISTDPWLLDSIPALDSFAAVAQQQVYGQLVSINALMTDPSKSDQQISDMITANLALDATDQNQSNYKLLNDIYLNYFAGQYSDLPADILATLTAIAQQCYVSGGASVFQARSMYWIATGSSDLSYTDDCIATTGSFRTKAPDTNLLAANTSFKVYPNPIAKDGSFTILSPASGELHIYDLLGRIVSEQDLVKGNNTIFVKSTESMLIYVVALSGGATYKGKLALQKQ